MGRGRRVREAEQDVRLQHCEGKRNQRLARCPAHLVSGDGDEVHGVVHGLQDPKDGSERLLEVVTAVATLAVLQQFLKRRGRGRRKSINKAGVQKKVVLWHICEIATLSSSWYLVILWTGLRR